MAVGAHAQTHLHPEFRGASHGGPAGGYRRGSLRSRRRSVRRALRGVRDVRVGDPVTVGRAARHERAGRARGGRRVELPASARGGRGPARHAPSDTGAAAGRGRRRCLSGGRAGGPPGPRGDGVGVRSRRRHHRGDEPLPDGDRAVRRRDRAAAGAHVGRLSHASPGVVPGSAARRVAVPRAPRGTPRHDRRGSRGWRWGGSGLGDPAAGGHRAARSATPRRTRTSQPRRTRRRLAGLSAPTLRTRSGRARRSGPRSRRATPAVPRARTWPGPGSCTNR